MSSGGSLHERRAVLPAHHKSRYRLAALGALVALALAAVVAITPGGSGSAAKRGRLDASIRPALANRFTGFDATVHRATTLQLSRQTPTDRTDRRVRL